MLPPALTVFGGAFLLFQAQPLMGRFILPWLGGTPSVWTTCVLFFQVLLLGGYAYAHGVSAWATPRRQAQVHGALLLAAVATLPIIPSDAGRSPAVESPTPHVLLLLLATVGLPGFVLTATGPLVQKWHAWLVPGRPAYRLYALSNAGSLLALLSYPVLFEPAWTRAQQAWAWSGGFVLFVLLSGWCAWRVGQLGSVMPDREAGADELEPRKPSVGRRLLWVALTACGSALLLAVTNTMCYDLVSLPLFWVVPLSLYLLSFVLSFDSPGWYRRAPFMALLVVGAWNVCRIATAPGDVTLPWQLLSYLVTLLAGCMVCHGETYHLRPHPRHLTGFYLSIALGGALGGAFVAVVAPSAFDGYHELYWAIGVTGVVAWLALKPEAPAATHGRRRTWLWAAGAPVVGALCALVWATGQAVANRDGLIAATRSFYGALSVVEHEIEGGTYRELSHGTITHGLQILDPGRSRVATSYYGVGSGVGAAMRALPSDGGRRVGLVGLGAGTLAAYGRPGDVFRFYELSPDVERMAREYFTFLEESEAEVEVVLGDARLSLSSEEAQGYDLIVLDAFNGDAVPIHLLTQEAFEEYRRHLRPGGAIAVHISNKYIDLEPVVRGAADHLGLAMTVVGDPNEDEEWWIHESTWALLGVSGAAGLPALGGFVTAADATPKRLWTDEYSSVFGILTFR